MRECTRLEKSSSSHWRCFLPVWSFVPVSRWARKTNCSALRVVVSSQAHLKSRFSLLNLCMVFFLQIRLRAHSPNELSSPIALALGAAAWNNSEVSLELSSCLLLAFEGRIPFAISCRSILFLGGSQESLILNGSSAVFCML